MTKRIAVLLSIVAVLLGVSAWQGNPYITTPTLIAPIITNGLTAVGSVANDFSGSTGTFKTSTGAVTLGTGAISVTGLPTFTAGLLASGAVANDFSASTGTFKTSSGANTLSGATTIPVTASLTLGTAGSAVGQALFTNATSGSITVAPPTGALGTPTNTLPANTGGLPAAYDCGSTGTGSQTCSPAAVNGQFHIYYGHSTLSSNAATITFPIAFTSTSTFDCVANDITTRANVVQMVPASASTATITNTTGGSDVIQWHCGGQ